MEGRGVRAVSVVLFVQSGALMLGIFGPVWRIEGGIWEKSGEIVTGVEGGRGENGVE